MKFLILMSLLLEICSGAKLGSNYLPPNGEGLGLSVPRPGGNGRPNGNGGPQLTPQRKRASGNSNGDAKNAEKSGRGPVYTTFDGSNGGGAGAGGESVPILSYESINNGNGNYKFSYETGNGIKVEEEGKLKNAGTDNEIQSAVGSFSYTAPDGQEIKIEYSADESGFVPKGNHLPTPPPIPEEILKSLEQNAAEEAIGNGRNGGNGNGGGGGNGYRY